MIFTLTREKLQEGMAAVMGSVPSRSNLPVLSHVLLEAEDDSVRLTGYDLDTATTVHLPAEVEEAGSVTLPGKKLQEIAKEAPPAPVCFSVKGQTVVVRGGRSIYRINALAAEEFPQVPRVGFTDARRIRAGGLQQMIAHVSFAVSTEETRPILNGVLWTLEAERMSMVATNGHRLARMRADVEAPALVGAGSSEMDTGADLIVHPRAFAQLGKVFAGDQDVEIARSENHLAFRAGHAYVVTRLIEGLYPNYTAVLPTDNDKSLIVEKASLAAALRRANIVAAANDNHRLRFSLGGPMLRISANTPDIGEEEEELPVEYEGGPLEIGFNAKYLLEILQHMPTDEVRMTFLTAERAASVEPLGNEDTPDLLMVLMPLRLLD
jgi:DNA polymerase-3 subunit beta